MMISLFTEPTDKRADVGIGFVVFVIPHQETGHANLVRLASSCGKAQVRQPKKRGQLLNSNAASEKQRLRPRSDFTNDRRRIADLGRVISRLW
jgi:hypothetical protein